MTGAATAAAIKAVSTRSTIAIKASVLHSSHAGPSLWGRVGRALQRQEMVMKSVIALTALAVGFVLPILSFSVTAKDVSTSASSATSSGGKATSSVGTGGCKIVHLKPGESPPSGSMTSSVTAGGGKVSGYTTGGNSATVHSGDGSSVATAGSSGGSTSTTVSSGSGCTTYIQDQK